MFLGFLNLVVFHLVLRLGNQSRLARVSTRMKKNCFSSPLDCVEGNGRCRIAEVGRVRGWCSIRWISA
ncbi:hypothetical protein SORBI_3007G202540 [Sorghum bicolor]|uniref:Secreted protein n=1 Tax=Sorghum bicolor TaxID=4558 RepID=A0A1Z5RAZ1_SORBI|nr:hypothetical protein SORBI_3007G202540 [Sorghum bicolor]